MKALPVIALMLFVLGCKKPANNIVGTWNSMRRGATTIWHFYPDGKLLTEVNYEGHMLTTTGTYSIDGDLFSMTNTEAKAITPDAKTEAYRQQILVPGQIRIQWKSPYSIHAEVPDSNEPLILSKMNPNP